MFRFKQFGLSDTRSGMKIGTDGVLLGAWTLPPFSASSVLDVGAGCGLISLMLAQRYPEARISAVEIDAGACADCRDNIASSPWLCRVEVIETDFIDYARTTTEKFSLIVSNPPFFSSGALSPEEKRASARHEASLSYASLIGLCPGLITPTGILAMIAPAEREEDIIFTAEMKGLKLKRLCRVCSVEGKPPVRVMFEFSPADTLRPEITTLFIRSAGGEFSPEYIQLTKDFYLHF